MKYFPGRYFNLQEEMKRRTIVLRLKGAGVLVSIAPLKISYGMVGLCFGATNVRVYTSLTVSLKLQDWIDAWEKCGDFDKIIGFSGPAGSDLYIVFEKEFAKK